MATLIEQRCFHHLQREAVAKCPECTKYFCRECITEHENRVICASCLKRKSENKVGRKTSYQPFKIFCKISISFFTLWLLFYALGYMLLSIPSSFHEGTLWKGMIDIVNYVTTK